MIRFGVLDLLRPVVLSFADATGGGASDSDWNELLLLIGFAGGVSVLQSLVADVNREMEAYKLYAVVSPVIHFVTHLTNWYIRRSRRRFWAHRGADDDRDKLAAFATLYEVLVTFAKVAEY